MQLKGLKICFIAGTLGQGGAERQLFYQLRALKQGGAQPALISFSRGEYWQTPIEALGVPVWALSPNASRHARAWQILRLVRRLRPQILQAAHFYVNLYAVLAARMSGAREVGAVRSNAIRDIEGLGMFLGSWSLKAPRFIAANSKNALHNLIDFGAAPSRLTYLPNVVDEHKFSPLSQGAAQSELHLIMVGRFVANKRFDLFLRTLAALNHNNTLKVIGHLVGDGKQRESLQHLAQELALPPALCHFHGAVADVERLYRQADICLHFSEWEGLPNTVLEAMACGLPVIASCVGDIPEIIQHEENGFLLNANEEEPLVALLRPLIADSSLRQKIGSAARATIEQQRSLAQLPRLLEDLYEKVLA